MIKNLLFYWCQIVHHKFNDSWPFYCKRCGLN